MPECCGHFWYPRPYEPTSRECPECGAVVDDSSRQRTITLDESVYEELVRRKGEQDWEDFLMRQLPREQAPALSD